MYIFKVNGILSLRGNFANFFSFPLSVLSKVYDDSPKKKRKKQNKERQERIANFCLANFFPFNSYDETIVNEAVVKTKFIRRELLLYSLYIYEVYVYAFPFAKYYLFTCYGYTSLSELFLFRRR